MADPWIKMRIDLVDDTAVLSLGTWLVNSGGIPAENSRKAVRRMVVGILLETWGLFHREADAEGVLPGFTKADIDEHVGIPSWCEAMIGVGWIDVTPAGVQACGFKKYIGSRKHNQAADRERKKPRAGVPPEIQRNSSGNGGGVPAALLTSLSSSSGSVQGEVQEGEPAAKGTSLARAIAKCLPPPDPRVVEAAKAWDEHTRDKSAQVGMNLVVSERAWLVQFAKAARDPAAWVAYVEENLGANANRLQDAPKRAGGANSQRLTAREASAERQVAAWDEFIHHLNTKDTECSILDSPAKPLPGSKTSGTLPQLLQTQPLGANGSPGLTPK